MRNVFYAFCAISAMCLAGPAWAVTGRVDLTTQTGQNIPTTTITITTKTDTGRVVKRTTHRTHTGITTEIPKNGRKIDIVITTENGYTTTFNDIDVEQLTQPGGYTVVVPGPGTGTTPVMPTSLNVYGLCNGGTFDVNERLAATNTTTFQSTDTKTGCGGGVGLVFAPWYMNGMVTVSPFVTAAFLGQDIRHTFTAGSYIGERINFIATAGLQTALFVRANTQIYALGGLALVDKKFTIAFAPGAVASEQWLWGGTLGLGASYQPPGLMIGNRPIKMFGQWQYIWVQDGKLNAPANSAPFNYTFGNGMSLFTVGLSIPLVAP